MIMNEGKCYVMFLNKHVTYPKEFVVNDTKLQVVDYVELLDVIIDKNINFSRLEKLCKSAKFKLMTLKRLRPFISEKKALLLAKTFIYSQFNYCPLSWMFCDKYHNSKINKREHFEMFSLITPALLRNY